MITVTLTEYEMAMCERVGRDRYADARERRRDPGLGPTSEGKVAGDIRGAQCEFACSLGLNLFWRPWFAVVKGNKDVGDLAEVRSTDLPNGRLIVKPAADDDDPYVLVRQTGRTHDLLGWLEAGTAKRIAPLTKQFGDPMHMIDRKFLRDIYTLKRRLHHGLALECVGHEPSLAATSALRNLLAEQDQRTLRMLIRIKPDGPRDAARIVAQVGGLLERGVER